MFDPLSPYYVPSVFIFKRKAAVHEKSKEQNSDKFKMVGHIIRCCFTICKVLKRGGRIQGIF